MIGLFDSGSGGLSVLRAFRARAPRVDIVYFGDIKNAPYGIRSAEELHELAYQGIHFLKEIGATGIIAACNSVSPSILAFDAGEVPIIEMSLPTAQALRRRAGHHFLLMATPATIASGLYEHAVEGNVSFDPLPIPALAGAIEHGASGDEIRHIVRESLSVYKDRTYDGVILGCTHYPLVRSLIEEEVASLFGSIESIDPAEAVAQEAVDRFGTEGDGRLTFYISQDSEPFRARVKELVPDRTYTIEIVEKISEK